MSAKVRILNLEDNVTDSMLIRHMLEAEGIPCEIVRVEAAVPFREALERSDFDLIISDFSLPSFNGAQGLKLARQLQPDIPFIFFSGTIGEEPAIESLTQGATDYVLKQRPARLAPAVRRALREAETQRQKKAAEAALRASEERFRAMVEKAAECVVVTDAEGTITYATPSLAKVTGRAVAEMIGQKMFAHLHPEDTRKITALLEEMQQIPEQGFSLMVRLQHRDGTWRALEGVVTNLFDNPAVRGIVINVRDVTERQQLEKQFQQAQKMEILGLLAGGVAHDFNNILQAIFGLSELLLPTLSAQDPRYQDVTEIREAARRAQNLVRQLLTFSRKQTIETRVLNLNDLLTNQLKMLRRLIGENIRLEFEPTPHAWLVRADPGQLEQCLMNLVVNARDALPQGGRIVISTANVVLEADAVSAHADARAGRFLQIVVSDNGTGMSPEVQRHLFEPFFTTKGVGKGTGLGLAVVQGIVKQNGGWIMVSSHEGAGSTFSIHLPAVDESTEIAATVVERSSGKAPQGAPKRILVVEDEAGVRSVVLRLLEAAGYVIREATTGKEAWVIFQAEQGRFDLLLSDVVLPDQNGVELADQLLAQNPHLRVLMVSGYADDRACWAKIRQKGFGFLQKPFALDDLLRAIKQALPVRSA